MRLTVNGVSVRVVDRIEIVLEVPTDGDTILNGVEIIAKGGTLRIEAGCKDNAFLIDFYGLAKDKDGVQLYCIGHDGPPPGVDLFFEETDIKKGSPVSPEKRPVQP